MAKLTRTDVPKLIDAADAEEGVWYVNQHTGNLCIRHSIGWAFLAPDGHIGTFGAPTNKLVRFVGSFTITQE